LSPPLPSSLAAIKPANPRSPGKPLNGERVREILCPICALRFERIGLIRFLTGCHKRRLNQAVFYLLVVASYWLGRVVSKIDLKYVNWDPKPYSLTRENLPVDSFRDNEELIVFGVDLGHVPGTRYLNLCEQIFTVLPINSKIL